MTQRNELLQAQGTSVLCPVTGDVQRHLWVTVCLATFRMSQWSRDRGHHANGIAVEATAPGVFTCCEHLKMLLHSISPY